MIHAARAHYDMCLIHQLTTDIKIFQDMSNLAQISCHISILEQTNKESLVNISSRTEVSQLWINHRSESICRSSHICI